MWELEAYIQTRANGAIREPLHEWRRDDVYIDAPTAGTVTNYGMPVIIASGATGGTTPVAVTADLTADTALSLTALWGTNNAANSIRLDMYTIESIN